jgi:chaperonin GroEL
MVYRPKIDDKLCFVLMPFGHPFDSYYQKIIKPAASDAGLATLRSDEIYSTKAIIKDIWARIWAARVIVADVTGRNPNVNYELGLCDALGVPAIIIAGNIEDVPFDYKHRRCILYSREDAGWDDKLRTDLGNTIQAVLAEATNEDELDWPYNTSILREPQLAGVLIASADSRKIVIRGATLVRDAIASAFGPHGTAVAISQAFGGTKQSQRGAQIAQGIKSSNPLEEKGIEQIRSAASSVYDSAGDGSKLVSILTAGLMTKGQELIEKGFHPKDVLGSLERSVKTALKHLNSEAQPVTGKELLAVATTAASGDVRVGTLVVEAMKRAGKHGIIVVETSSQSDTALEVLEGVRFDRGYLSEYFVTNAETIECVLENCFILFHQGRIQSMKDLLPLLEQVARTDKSLLIIAEDVEGEALATLTLNKIKGILRCAAVKAPGEGDRRKALMEDIAVLTGGRFLSQELGIPLANVRLEDLGKAEKVTVTHHDTTIIGGAGPSGGIQERVRSIQTQISNTTSAYEREKYQERLARLAGSVAVLKAGGVSEADVLQEIYRLESAMHSARSAIEDGRVAGGGVALLRAGITLRGEKTDNVLDNQTSQAVASVLEDPIRQLIENAQKSPTQILAEIVKSNSSHCGFNAAHCEIEDLVNAGVLDPLRPIDLSLRVALSHAGSVLQTGTWDLSAPPTPPQRPGQIPNA